MVSLSVQPLPEKQMAKYEEPTQMAMITTTPEDVGVREYIDCGGRENRWEFDEEDPPPHQTSGNSHGLNAEMPDVSLTTSGLSYAEHMLYDTMQMTRRSAASASATLANNKTQAAQMPISAGMTNSLRIKNPLVASCLTTAALTTRLTRESATPRTNRTSPKPFLLAVDRRTRSPRIVAHKSQDGIPASRPKSAGHMQHQIRTSSAPKLFQWTPKVTRPQPFHLSSVIRHNAKMHELNNMRQKEVEAEARARDFKARPFSVKSLQGQGVKSCPPRQQCHCVKVEPFNLESQRRHQRYVDQILPEKMRKEAEKNKLELKAARQLKEQQAKELRQLRQRLQFKARPAPSRSHPVFEPDYRLAKPPTKPTPFVLATDTRIGMDFLGSKIKSQSHINHADNDSADEEVEDDEDLDDGSGCSDLDESTHPLDPEL